jgi:XTP/dITP diphosphohydrolase
MKKVVLASGNAGKLKEFQQLLSGLGFEVLPMSDFTDESPEETGLSFVENAIIKARFASQHSGLPALADDSGLEVDALRGQPGIYSSRFAGPGASDADNNQKLLNSLEGLTTEERTARFQCALVFMDHAEDPTPLITQGSWEGHILHSLSGAGGFGYDPLFYVPEKDCASAELTKEQKNALSHRGKAVEKMLALLGNR